MHIEFLNSENTRLLHARCGRTFQNTLRNCSVLGLVREGVRNHGLRVLPELRTHGLRSILGDALGGGGEQEGVQADQ